MYFSSIRKAEPVLRCTFIDCTNSCQQHYPGGEAITAKMVPIYLFIFFLRFTQHVQRVIYSFLWVVGVQNQQKSSHVTLKEKKKASASCAAPEGLWGQPRNKQTCTPIEDSSECLYFTQNVSLSGSHAIMWYPWE